MDPATAIRTAIAASDYPALHTFFTSTHPTLNPGEQRSLSAHFISHAVSSPTFFPSAFRSPLLAAVLDVTLSNLPPVVEGGADNALRHKMFEFKVERGDYAAAARVLSGMKMDDNANSVYYAKPVDRCDVFVKVAECYLEEDMTVEAEGAVGKAGGVIEAHGIGFPREIAEGGGGASNVDGDDEPQRTITLLLRYKSTYARILDSNRKFLQAAMKYYDLSTAYLHTDDIDEEELIIMLGKAVTCAILSPNSAQRQRVLGMLYKDERLAQLDSIPEFQSHSSILTKMFLNRIVQKQELETFESSLAEHQKAIMSDGLTIVERGVLEHNMVAVSHLYTSIYFSQLASLLGVVDADKAEKVAAKMISDGSLSGEIDDVEGLLRFFRRAGGAGVNLSMGEEEESTLIRWDETITNFCVQLNKVTDAVKAV